MQYICALLYSLVALILNTKLDPLLDEICFIFHSVFITMESAGRGLLSAVHVNVISVYSDSTEFEGKLLFNETTLAESKI